LSKIVLLQIESHTINAIHWSDNYVKLSYLRHAIAFYNRSLVNRSAIYMLKTFPEDFTNYFKFTVPLKLWDVSTFFSSTNKNAVYHKVMFTENNILIYDENGSFESIHKKNKMFPARFSVDDVLDDPDLCPQRDYSDIIPVSLFPFDITSIEGAQRTLFTILERHPKNHYILMKNDIAVNLIYLHTLFSSNPKINLDQFVINLGSFHVAKHLANEIFEAGFDSFFFEMFALVNPGVIYRKPKFAKLYPFLTYVQLAFEKVKPQIMLLERENSVQKEDFDELYYLLEVAITVMRNMSIENTMDDFDKYLSNLASAVPLFVKFESSRYVEATLMQLLLLENLKSMDHPMLKILKKYPSCLNEEREESYLSILDRVLSSNQQANVHKTDEIVRLLPQYLIVSKELDPQKDRAIVSINDATVDILKNNILQQFTKLSLGTHKTPQLSGISVNSSDSFNYEQTKIKWSKYNISEYILDSMNKYQEKYQENYILKYVKAFRYPNKFNYY
jgi:hypothetical protein